MITPRSHFPAGARSFTAWTAGSGVSPAAPGSGCGSVASKQRSPTESSPSETAAGLAPSGRHPSRGPRAGDSGAPIGGLRAATFPRSGGRRFPRFRASPFRVVSLAPLHGERHRDSERSHDPQGPRRAPAGSARMDRRSTGSASVVRASTTRPRSRAARGRAVLARLAADDEHPPAASGAESVYSPAGTASVGPAAGSPSTSGRSVLKCVARLAPVRQTWPQGPPGEHLTPAPHRDPVVQRDPSTAHGELLPRTPDSSPMPRPARSARPSGARAPQRPPRGRA